MIDWRSLYERADALLSDFELKINVRTLVRDLPVGARQVVEIAKALSLDAKILLLDEPTSALSPDEKQALLRLIRRLTSLGLGALYGSHHLCEVLEITDRITALRDGRRLSCRRASETTERLVFEEMVGRFLDATDRKTVRELGAERLRLDGVHVPGRLHGIDLSLREGEVVGLAGLLGSGARAVGEVTAGLAHPSAGSMRLHGAAFAPSSLRAAIVHGVGSVPEERRTDGLFLDISLRGKTVAASLPRHTNYGILSEKCASRAAT